MAAGALRTAATRPGGSRRSADRVGQMLLLIALSALAIGGLGISSAAAAFAESRRSAIAILKLLGARRRTVGSMLALEVAAIALVAIGIGLAIGAVAPALIADVAAGSLPLAPDRSVQPLALAEAGLFGLLVTVAASWSPVARAVEERPAEVLRGDVGNSAEGSRRRVLVPVWSLVLAAAGLAIASATDPRFTAIGIGGIAVIAGAFAMLGLGLRRLARRLRHRGGPLARLGIAALDRPGSATVRLSVALGLGLSLLLMLAGVGSSLLGELQSNIPPPGSGPVPGRHPGAPRRRDFAPLSAANCPEPR